MKYSMKKQLQFAISAVTIWLVISQPAALAWNNFGHMAVAYLCYEQLTPPVRQRVDALTKLNPMYKEWAQQVSQSPADKDELMFMLSATWPDRDRECL